MSFIYIFSYLSMFYPLSIYTLLNLSNLIFKMILERRYTSTPVKNNLFSEVTQFSEANPNKTNSISNHLKINNHDILSNSNDYHYAIVDTNALNERIIKIKGIFVNNVFYSNEFINREGNGSPKTGKLSFMKIFEEKKEDAQSLEKVNVDSALTLKQGLHLDLLPSPTNKSPTEVPNAVQRINQHISFSYISNLIRDEKELRNKHEMFKAMCLCHYTQSKRTENKKIEDENVFHYMTEDDEKILNFAKINGYVFKSVVYNKDNTFHCNNKPNKT